MGKFQEGSPVRDNFRKAAWCGTGSNTQRPLCWFQEGSLVWDKKVQGMVLGAFFWGYLVSQLPAGLLAVRVGGKWCFGGAMLVAGLVTLLTPVVASHSFQGLMVLRILLGAASVSSLPLHRCSPSLSLSVSLCLCVCLSVCLSLSVFLWLCLSVSLCVSVSLSLCLSLYSLLSISLSVCLSILYSLSLCLSVSLCLSLPPPPPPSRLCFSL